MMERIKRRLLFSAIGLVIGLIIIAVRSDGPTDVETGKQSGRTYENSDLGMRISIPEGWHVADRATIERTIGPMPEGSGSKILLMASAHPMGSEHVAYNGNILLIAERIPVSRKVTDAPTYMRSVRRQMIQNSQDGHTDGDLYVVTIGGEVFGGMDWVSGNIRLRVRQKYLSAIRKGHAVNFIISYADPADLAAAFDALKTLEFTPANDETPAGALTLAQLIARHGGDGRSPTARAPVTSRPGITHTSRPSSPAGPANLDEALTAVRGTNSGRQLQGLKWLSSARVEEDKRKEVTTAVLPLLGNHTTDGPAIDVLGKWGTEDCVPALLDYRIRNNLSTDGRKALEVLCTFKDERIIPSLVGALGTSHGDDIVKALARYGEAAQKAVLPMVNHHSTQHRTKARKVLEMTECPSGLIAAQCVRDLDANPDPTLNRNKAMYVRLRRSAAWEQLAGLEPDDKQREAVLKALAPVAEERIPDRQAIAAIGKWSDKYHVELLLKCARHSYDQMRDMAIRRLIKLEHPEAAEMAGYELREPHQFVMAKEHFKLLGEAGEKELCRYLRFKDWQTRRRVCQILRDLGTKDSLEHLRWNALKDPNNVVRAEARTAYMAIKKRN